MKMSIRRANNPITPRLQPTFSYPLLRKGLLVACFTCLVFEALVTEGMQPFRNEAQVTTSLTDRIAERSSCPRNVAREIDPGREGSVPLPNGESPKARKRDRILRFGKKVLNPDVWREKFSRTPAPHHYGKPPQPIGEPAVYSNEVQPAAHRDTPLSGTGESSSNDPNISDQSRRYPKETWAPNSITLNRPIRDGSRSGLQWVEITPDHERSSEYITPGQDSLYRVLAHHAHDDPEKGEFIKVQLIKFIADNPSKFTQYVASREQAETCDTIRINDVTYRLWDPAQGDGVIFPAFTHLHPHNLAVLSYLEDDSVRVMAYFRHPEQNFYRGLVLHDGNYDIVRDKPRESSSLSPVALRNGGFLEPLGTPSVHSNKVLPPTHPSSSGDGLSASFVGGLFGSDREMLDQSKCFSQEPRSPNSITTYPIEAFHKQNVPWVNMPDVPGHDKTSRYIKTGEDSVFRVLAYHGYRDQGEHETVKEDLVAFIRNNPEQFREYIITSASGNNKDDHTIIIDGLTYKLWDSRKGDGVMFAAFPEVYAYNLAVLSYDKDKNIRVQEHIPQLKKASLRGVIYENGNYEVVDNYENFQEKISSQRRKT
ncbi:hypothetical protein MJO28_015472 [Puccinia striiformis f. sp. tritici]|uniref:Uncharacterized protein n=2 Tax=Puccinia striiformis TaxID=27350 RepID=A0A2S4VUI2_9BASI|nr:hypothetical protein Pst134EB_033187 [Puccinia striiformis f. sp. tritici]KAI7937871.1 hypothetical protein MJO29_015186 [Puccinia striiformis f. sp. tritici]KAI7938552.1 hypothetical protein MJO28_015472 [Puccinia striiformis f. sp. tritici]KAI9617938.1 hypothetical protein H4Q26_012805 [Puccinia striiformis f. sp. tritici PST-130]POW13181.1 hypothetical protein PSTT_03971 [Puccinia striiformis]